MRGLRAALLLAASLALAGCAVVPTGPSVMALPGTHRSFARFQADDATCRDWASLQSGARANASAARSGVASAAVGTAVGAAAGAALGAAAGAPGTGAAIGAGSGLLVGSSAGVGRADHARHEVQTRYDQAYLQCMYAQGNRIPMARGSVPSPTAPAGAAPAPPSTGRPIPPPPAGPPPPPPPG